MVTRSRASDTWQQVARMAVAPVASTPGAAVAPTLGVAPATSACMTGTTGSTSSPPPRLQVRHLMLFMISFGIFLVYSMRVNLSVTIIAMVNTTATQGNQSKVLTSECPLSPASGSSLSNQSDIPIGEFLWDQETQSYVLNAFFYGYIVTQIPGGWLSEVIDPGWIFVGGIGVTSLLTLATALVARASFAAFLVLRVLEGIAEGVTYPSMYALLARWSPIGERSMMTSVSNIGSLLGTVVTLPLAAVLCKHGFAGGWPSVFYLTGLLGVVWCIFWILLASGSPEKHKFISAEEKYHIITSRDAIFSVHKPVPWLSILTSRGVWLCAFVKFCASWTFYTLLTELPSYLSNVLHFDIQKGTLMGYEAAVLCTGGITGLTALMQVLRRALEDSFEVMAGVFRVNMGAGPELARFALTTAAL
ncbi:hypothetical protein HPB51_001067 [Rhipicephalus microplus]|uniref:Major facilitator superfamily (MFS) profile domain-containing protein n=1 Tax=Rhipicephalus microplus TaxID=6941 RepID=A0A9J6DRI5_RHIMP|nr:hypothetical protein HPB51_001067 [Rhipicephalus microplus]